MFDIKFNEIKKNKPRLLMFLKNFPKGGDLHTHSLGSGYSEFIYNKAIERNSYFNTKTHIFLTEEEYNNIYDTENIVSIDEFKRSYSNLFFENYSTLGLKNIKDGANHFFSAFPKIISSKIKEEELILEMANRSILENISYLEIISDCIPQDVISSFKDHFDLECFDISKMNEYIKILEKLSTNTNLLKVKKYLNERDEFLKENLKGEINIKYLPYLRRVSSSLMEFFVEGYYSILYSLEDNRIGGINLVEVENHLNSRLNFSNHLVILKYLYKYFKEKYKTSPNFSLHAGELTLDISPLEDMSSRIHNTIFLSETNENEVFTKRIGHGVSISWEDTSTLNILKKNKIPVEICLTSNEFILDIKEEFHPFNLYKSHQVPMVICTDDEGISRTNLIMEFFKATLRYDLSYDELKNLARNSLEFSFLKGESLFDPSPNYSNSYYKNFRKEFHGVSTLNEWDSIKENYLHLISKNEKLRLQIKLEEDFLKFENLSFMNKL